jgi:hypothetical protein
MWFGKLVGRGNPSATARSTPKSYSCIAGAKFPDPVADTGSNAAWDTKISGRQSCPPLLFTYCAAQIIRVNKVNGQNI